MFSYRHGFHAGNHADVLKHTVLIAALQHMAQKETAISVIDTQACTAWMATLPAPAANPRTALSA